MGVCGTAKFDAQGLFHGDLGIGGSDAPFVLPDVTAWAGSHDEQFLRGAAGISPGRADVCADAAGGYSRRPSRRGGSRDSAVFSLPKLWAILVVHPARRFCLSPLSV